MPLLAAAVLATALASPVSAADDFRATLIKAEGEAQASVANDQLTISLALEREGADTARLHDEIQQEAGRALAAVKKVAGVSARTGGYAVYPVHEKGRIVRHRASYRLVLETRDFAAGLRLAGELQPFVVSGMSFSLSRERQRKTEQALIEQAIGDLRERLRVAARAIGAGEWRITQLQVGDIAAPAPRHLRAEAMAMSADRAAAPVEAEAGETQVSVRVSGSARTLGERPREREVRGKTAAE
jgi:predicted secreted protein